MAGTGLRISVENFGPIRRGEISVKPLTLLIGANNSGKSYVALLLYALHQSLSPFDHQPLFVPTLDLTDIEESEPSRSYEDEVETESEIELERWFVAARRRRRERHVVDPPKRIQDLLRRDLDRRIATTERRIRRSLEDYFRYDSARELIFAAGDAQVLRVGFGEGKSGKPLVELALYPADDDFVFTWSLPPLESIAVPLNSVKNIMGPPSRDEDPEERRVWIREVFNDFLWLEILDGAGVPAVRAHYLPAARSGIVQGSQSFASFAVDSLRRSVRDSRSSGPFTGVTADFLRTLYGSVLSNPRSSRESKLQPALEVLESDVLGGEVRADNGKLGQGGMRYYAGALQLPLHRASSMIAELGPLDLWLRYVLNPHHLLIIDEPEAHLHPENQRRVARVLARLMNLNVTVVAPTHSSLILHQISNYILAHDLNDEERERLNLEEIDAVSADQVGAHIFVVGPQGGIEIRSMPIDPELGIPEDEFVQVAEAIGDETYRLMAAVESK